MKRMFLVGLWLWGVLLPLMAVRIEHGPYLQNVGEREATVVWISDKPSVGWIEIAPDDGTHFYAEKRTQLYDTRIGIKVTSRIHAVELKGLTPGTRYRYRVCVQEVLEHKHHQVFYGQIASTDVYTKKPLTFTTNDASKPEVSFAMVNDIHGLFCHGERHTRAKRGLGEYDRAMRPGEYRPFPF